MAHMSSSNTSDISKTETVDEPDGGQQAEAPTLVLRLEQPRDKRRVVFQDGIIDNEHMNRMKSKCCCIYKKPLAFGESSSEDDDECEHCFGHPEKRKKNKKKPAANNNDSCHPNEQPSTSAEAQSKPIQGTTANPTAAAVREVETTVQPSL
ncbi:uncharacterized protein ZK945.8 [Drosophila grimshawi]|uniref:E3 ubiquitin-protein ligase PPP1R11 n=1 Tax=Drosophila grimshawi TaxID=7222 RepID=B4JB09_DROGR|nr:uncharacterized protein ZK945.8 [Drosophila grimshawi]EDW02879.1 GH10799 [Drosophila grimshawi]